MCRRRFRSRRICRIQFENRGTIMTLGQSMCAILLGLACAAQAFAAPTTQPAPYVVSISTGIVTGPKGEPLGRTAIKAVVSERSDDPAKPPKILCRESQEIEDGKAISTWVNGLAIRAPKFSPSAKGREKPATQPANG